VLPARTARGALLLAAALLAGCAREAPEPERGVLVVSQEQAASWIRNFNPLTTATAARWPTVAGVYEPLFVFNSVTSEFVPWLGLSREWQDGGRSLRITTRDSVLWSDGAPFSARDVAFTFNLMKQLGALDRRGVWEFLEAVEAVDDQTVEFRFTRIFIPGFGDVAAQPIVPEHIWKDIEDPVAFPNENPVATGPFTEVRLFRNQVYELGKNPHYWQPGRPGLEALRFPSFPANDNANLALVFDEVDWAGNFIPAIDRVYVSRDPENHKYWFPLTGSTVFLYANTTKPPFDDVRARKALSLAIDRQLLVDVAVHRYSRPADATGLSDAYAAWRDPEAAAADWVGFDVDRANALLDDAGLSWGPDGVRLLPDGTPLKYDLLVVSGWSDWVRASQVISRGLGEIGVDASVRTYDFGAWFQRVQEGDFDLSIGWSLEGPTPWVFYRTLMSSASVEPIGANAGANWHRYGSPAADAALAEFEVETDLDRQHEIAARLQRIFAEEAPAIPLYPNPSWAEYNTKRFTGFPSADNPYADPSPNKMDRGECLLVLTALNAR
jgi:peptide/nickel transport system substrate-binding protein